MNEFLQKDVKKSYWEKATVFCAKCDKRHAIFSNNSQIFLFYLLDTDVKNDIMVTYGRYDSPRGAERKLNMTESERIAKLTADAKKGDSAAFEALYTAFGKRIYYFCYTLLGDEQAAMDATEDTFVYTRRNIRQLPAGQTFYRWACGNAFYFAKIALAGQKGSSANIEPLTDADPSCFEIMLENNKLPTPEPTIRRADLEAVTELLSTLSDSDRMCLLLYDYAAFTPDEAANIAACSADTVKCRICNAHEVLIAGMEAKTAGFGELLRPHLGRLLRTCGRNCTPPAELEDRVRAALLAVEEEFPDVVPEASEDKPRTLSNRTTTVLYAILGAMLVLGLIYVLYWFMSAPDDKTGNTESKPSTSTQSTTVSGSESLPADPSGDVEISDEISKTVSEEGSDAPDEPEVSDEPSQDVSQPEEPSQPEESSQPDESSQPEDNTPAELPRTTTRLRLRSAPDTSDNNNIIVTIPANTHVEIKDTVTTEDGTVWYFVRYTVGSGLWHDGYCAAEYIQTEEVTE